MRTVRALRLPFLGLAILWDASTVSAFNSCSHEFDVCTAHIGGEYDEIGGCNSWGQQVFQCSHATGGYSDQCYCS